MPAGGTQLMLYGEALTVPMGCKSTEKFTWCTPTLSVAVALTVKVPGTNAPNAGSVMAQVGGVLSGTVTVTPADVPTLPAASEALQVNTWLPAEAVAVSQLTLYGEVGSLPSNC